MGLCVVERRVHMHPWEWVAVLRWTCGVAWILGRITVSEGKISRKGPADAVASCGGKDNEFQSSF